MQDTETREVFQTTDFKKAKFYAYAPITIITRNDGLEQYSTGDEKYYTTEPNSPEKYYTTEQPQYLGKHVKRLDYSGDPRDPYWTLEQFEDARNGIKFNIIKNGHPEPKWALNHNVTYPGFLEVPEVKEVKEVNNNIKLSRRNGGKRKLKRRSAKINFRKRLSKKRNANRR